MSAKVTRQPGTDLVDGVMALYDELAEVSATFLAAIVDGPPEEQAQTLFWTARKDLVERLQPLLAQEEQWLSLGDGDTQRDRRQTMALQLQKMERLATLDRQISARLAILRAQIDEELKAISQGKKGLSGYRVGLKVAPRFCRIAA